MTHKNTKTIAILGATIFLVSVAVCAGFWYQVLLHKETLKAHMTEVATTKAQKEELAALVRTVQATADDRASLKTRILGAEGVIDFLTRVEELGAERGVELKTSALTVVPQNEVFETLQMTITVTGSYDAVLEVLTLIELIPYQSVISHVSISRGGEGGAGDWEGVFDLQVTKFKKL